MVPGPKHGSGSETFTRTFSEIKFQYHYMEDIKVYEYGIDKIDEKSTEFSWEIFLIMAIIRAICGWLFWKAAWSDRNWKKNCQIFN